MTPETITITLSPDVAAMLAQMAIATEQSAPDLAASLLAEVLHDDALAHGRVELSIVSEPAPVAEEAEAVDQRPDPVGSPAPKRRGRPPASAHKAIREAVRKKTAAEIRREVRKPDPIVAEAQARELAKKVPLPAPGKKTPLPLKGAPKPAPVDPPKPEPIVPKVVVDLPPGSFTPGEDSTIRTMRSVGAGPYDIAKALKRDVTDVRRRIAELWVRK